MKPAVRRGLLFLAMVGTGVAAVLLLADPFATRRDAHVESLTGTEDTGVTIPPASGCEERLRRPGLA